MADYFTQFSCVLRVGSKSNLDAALAIYQAFAAETEILDEQLSFTVKGEPPSGDSDEHGIWIYSDEFGEPEHVITYVLRCAEALNMTGIWGFRWSLSCSRPTLDGHGGGAHVLDLGTGQTIDWIDLDRWLDEQADAYELANHAPAAGADTPASPAEALPLPTLSAPSSGLRAADARGLLDLSAGHLTAATWTWLDQQTADDMVRDVSNRAYAILGGRTRQGWMLRTDIVPVSTIPVDLTDALLYAARRGCSYVHIDCDLLPMADLPVLHPDFSDAATAT